MRIDLFVDGELHSSIFVGENSTLGVVIPEGIETWVERAYTARETGDELLFTTRKSTDEPNNVVDCGAGVGDLGGLGRIGGVGERKDREDKGAREGERAELGLDEMEFPIQGGEMWKAGSVLVADLIAAYGHSSVERCFKKAKAWLACNPHKRKTIRGMPKFLNRWLAYEDKPIKQSNNSLNRDVRTTAKIVKGRPTVEGW